MANHNPLKNITSGIFILVAQLILFSGAAFPGEINGDAKRTFDEFNTNHGHTWKAVWDTHRGLTGAIIGYGEGYSSKGYIRKTQSHTWPSTILPLSANEPTPPSLPPPFPENKKISILSFSSSPDIFSPNGDGIKDSTDFYIKLALRHTDALEGNRHNSPSAQDMAYFVGWKIDITKSGSLITSLQGKSAIDLTNCIKGIHGASCQWIGHDLKIGWSPSELKDGVYGYQLFVNYIREIYAQNKTVTKIVDSESSGVGSLIIDTTPPEILFTSPQPNSAITTQTPLIEVTYSDPTAGIESNTLQVQLNTTDITNNLTVEPDRASYQVTSPLAEGIHRMYARIQDKAGNVGEARSNFAIILQTDKAASVNETNDFLRELAPVYGYSEDLHELYLHDFKETNIFSMAVYRQEVNSIPVIGGEIKVAISVENKPQGANGNFFGDAMTVSTTPTLSDKEAIDIGVEDLGQNQNLKDTSFALLRISPEPGPPRLVWETTLQNVTGAEPISWTYLIDATTGDIIHKFNNVLNACAPRAFVRAPYNLDNDYAEVSIENIVDPNGCLIGEYADVTNGQFSRLCSPDFSYFHQPFISDTPSDAVKDEEDSRTDEVTAYYNATKFAKTLEDELSYNILLTKSFPSQINVVTNGCISYGGGCDLDNAEAAPVQEKVGNETKLKDIKITIAPGSKLLPTQTSQGLKYIVGDWTRNPDVLFHEYGHGILFDKGLLTYTGIDSGYHEGFADFMAASVTNEPTNAEWLPSIFRSADNTKLEVGAEEAHEWGTVYSGSMWGFRRRLLDIYYNSVGTARQRSEKLALYSPDLYVLRTNRQNTFAEVIPPLLLTEAVYYVFRVLYEGDMLNFHHEIRAAFASHAVTEENKVAVTLPLDGERKDMGRDFVIYSGSNPKYKIYFAIETTNFDTSSCHISFELSTTPMASGFNNDRMAIYNAAADGAIADCYNALSPGTRAKVYFRATTYDPNNASTLRISDENAPHQYVYLERPEECTITPIVGDKGEFVSFLLPFMTVLILTRILNRNKTRRYLSVKPLGKQ